MSYRSPVRTARLLPLVLGLVGACVTQDTGYGGGYGGNPGGGYGGDPGGGYSPGSGGGGGYGCSQDSDCNVGSGSGNVCARDEECLPASEVWTVHVTWTVSGQPASAATCTSTPDLQLFFGEVGESGWDFGFAPVPCAEGEFTIDKLPTFYTQVGLLQDMTDSGGATGTFDGSGDSALDLPY